MATRLVPLDEGTEISLDRAMVVVGRHPQCDARLDSLRVSRHHCCMYNEHGEVLVKDLGSTNGIRINGQRVEFGRLRADDVLSIAHIRYRLENGQSHDLTLADPTGPRDYDEPGGVPVPPKPGPFGPPQPGSNALAAAGRDLLLPGGMADRCLIQVIVQKQPGEPKPDESVEVENHEVCRPDSSP